jgi:hypothetical protein
MSFLENWIELEIIMLNEISQSHKEKYHMLSVICRSWVQESGWTKQKKTMYSSIHAKKCQHQAGTVQ